MEKVNRLRTVVECEKLIKELDPQTAITEFFIRCLVKDDKIQHFMAGKKILVNYDELLRFLNFEKCEVSHA